MTAPNFGGDSSIHVASFIAVHDVLERTRARYLVTLLHAPALMPTPHWIEPGDHLRLACHDVVVEAADAPDAAHVRDLIAFAQRWNRNGPIVVHCMAGISRSTAAAFVVLCALNPQKDENALVAHLRAASPSAMPNKRLIALADTALARNGRMVAAIATIDVGGALAAPAKPFRLDSQH